MHHPLSDKTKRELSETYCQFFESPIERIGASGVGGGRRPIARANKPCRPPERRQASPMPALDDGRERMLGLNGESNMR